MDNNMKFINNLLNGHCWDEIVVNVENVLSSYQIRKHVEDIQNE